MTLMDPNKTAQFICEVEGVALDWYFNSTHEGEESMATSNTTLLNASESGAAVFSSHLWVPRAEEFDNMSIVCRARGGNASESQDSDVAWLKLEGLQHVEHVKCHLSFSFFGYSTFGGSIQPSTQCNTDYNLHFMELHSCRAHRDILQYYCFENG